MRRLKLSKLESYSETLSESSGCFTGIGVLVITLAASKWIFKLLEYLVINQVYGHAAWTDGLRVMDRHGGLSNGDFLSGWPLVMLYLGTFVLLLPFFFGSWFLFSYIGLRRKGRRLSDPIPKKRWRSSGKSDHAD
jgi:hypothetical protein